MNKILTSVAEKLLGIEEVEFLVIDEKNLALMVCNGMTSEETISACSYIVL